MNSVEHWTQRQLRLRKNYSAPIRFLLWVGFVKIGRKNNKVTVHEHGYQWVHPEKILWPFRAPPRHVFRFQLKYGPRFYVFRNLPGVIKWAPGRLLPLRWGFGVCGFELGDRG